MEARIWYSERLTVLGESFLNEIENAVEKIQHTPYSWLNYKFGTKRILIHRFPFAIIYRITESAIQIIAISHLRRKPFYWKDRNFK